MRWSHDSLLTLAKATPGREKHRDLPLPAAEACPRGCTKSPSALSTPAGGAATPAPAFQEIEDREPEAITAILRRIASMPGCWNTSMPWCRANASAAPAGPRSCWKKETQDTSVTWAPPSTGSTRPPAKRSSSAHQDVLLGNSCARCLSKATATYRRAAVSSLPLRWRAGAGGSTGASQRAGGRGDQRRCRGG